jgi:2-phosphoglycerate kinase
MRPPWDVLLLGGPSGVGKSMIAFELSRRFDATLTAVDDLYVAVQRMTSPSEHPELHRWETEPEVIVALDDDGMLAHALANAEEITLALEPVVAEHLGSSPPIVLEGDFLVPSLATKDRYDDVENAGRVRGLFLLDDEDQLARNFADREGEPQLRRARASARYGEWLAAECERLGVPTVAARPWETVLERAIAAAS